MEHLISTIRKIWVPLPDSLIPIDISPRKDYNPHQINLSHWPPIDLLQRVQIIAQVIGEKDYLYAHARMRRAVDIRIRETEEDGEKYCGERLKLFEAQDASALIKELRLEKQGRSKAPCRAAVLAEYGGAADPSMDPKPPKPITEGPPAAGEYSGKQQATGNCERDDINQHFSNSANHPPFRNPTPEPSAAQIQVQSEIDVDSEGLRETTDSSTRIGLHTSPHLHAAQYLAPTQPVLATHVQKRKWDGGGPPPESTRNIRRIPQSWLSSMQTSEEDLPGLYRKHDNVDPFAPENGQDHRAKIPSIESSIVGQKPAAPDTTASQPTSPFVAPPMHYSSNMSSALPQSSPLTEVVSLEMSAPPSRPPHASRRRKKSPPRRPTQEELASDEADDDPFDGIIPGRQPALPNRSDNLTAQVVALKLENERLKAGQASLHESLAILVRDLHQRQSEVNALKARKASAPQLPKSLKASEDRVKELEKEIRDLQSRPLTINEFFVQTLEELRERMLLSFSDEEGTVDNEDIKKLKGAIHATSKGLSDDEVLREHLGRDEEIREKADQKLETAETTLQDYLEALDSDVHAELMTLIGDVANARESAVAAERDEERSQQRLSRHNMMRIRAEQYKYLAEEKHGGLHIDPLMRDLLVPAVRFKQAVEPSTGGETGITTRSGRSIGGNG
ncbi:hypothetical protein BU16DRAFT_562550 [Lophium mytilinum]|uniref:Uncharacterized protein n=1 Tax=Lophium mytilinum TaxID=390894 RepID=A0A6A6QSE4_9PEZI|nr:hypothetical protein BU16DRAFT_562550 [Lophium mytilinum]